MIHIDLSVITIQPPKPVMENDLRNASANILNCDILVPLRAILWCPSSVLFNRIFDLRVPFTGIEKSSLATICLARMKADNFSADTYHNHIARSSDDHALDESLWSIVGNLKVVLREVEETTKRVSVPQPEECGDTIGEGQLLAI